MKWSAVALVLLFGVVPAPAAEQHRITIDYPAEGSVFPPDLAPPTFLWREPSEDAAGWQIEVDSGDGRPLKISAAGGRLQPGEIDPRAVADTNEPPRLTPEQAAARTWRPDAAVWAEIRKRSLERDTVVTIGGYDRAGQPVSRGRVTIRTSKDPVGAPIFYRDVPLMPSELEKGVVKPLAKAAIPMVGWRIRDVSQPRSRLLMEGLHMCANCHSFSRDGKTLGIEMNGPRDERKYSFSPVEPRMTIRNEDIITWKSLPLPGSTGKTLAFMPQISPDGQFAIATVNEAVYVANFKDYRFLQVFYPTRGILAYYSKATGRIRALPGADDPRYVQTNAVWSPDGSYLVFARATARDPYPADRKMAEYAGDPNEVPIQYDLFRIPFDGGKGGKPEPIPGASGNGKSNSFPRISPDGRWIVYVQARNGQLMRPDSELYIVPAAGGQARRMRCNTSRMNSWHSFSPNGRWMVFSSKSRSPYTQMFLTHLDEQGNDSPAILIEDSTAANRAVNLPEFVNIAPDGLLAINAPAAEFYRLFDEAWELTQNGKYEAAIEGWKRALAVSPGDAKAQSNFGLALARGGRPEEAVSWWRKALNGDPELTEAHNNLGIALAGQGKAAEALKHFEKAVSLQPDSAEALHNLGLTLAGLGRPREAVPHLLRAASAAPKNEEIREDLGTVLLGQGAAAEASGHFRVAVELAPESAQARFNLGRALAALDRMGEAEVQYRKAVDLKPGYAEAHNSLGVALARMGRMEEAMAEWRLAVRLEPGLAQSHDNLGRALAAKGRRQEAIASLGAAAGAYRSKGRTEEALDAERRARALR